MPFGILRDDSLYRLITDGDGRFAVLEARAGKVYSLHGRHRREAADTPQGMAAVVGDDGWSARSTAERRFLQMHRLEEKYSEILW